MRNFHIGVYGLIAGCFALVPAMSVAAGGDTVQVRQILVRPEYHAYAQVVPESVVTLRTSATGVIESMHLLSGERVRAGERLATLGGADYSARLHEAQASLADAKRDLEIARQNYPHFSSAGDLANATMAFKRTRAELDQIRAAGHVVAPCNGVVLVVKAANGERLAAGDALATLQPNTHLWLRAEYYGATVDSIRPGMKGRFLPDGRAVPVPVRVVSRFAALSPDGGEFVGLLSAESSATWRNGEYGTVTLYGPGRSTLLVPTRALILDQGTWWVMIRTQKGLRPRKVEPGESRGWQTMIVNGLNQGDNVVVENAWLDFHHAIAKSYSPPD